MTYMLNYSISKGHLGSMKIRLKDNQKTMIWVQTPESLNLKARAKGYTTVHIINNNYRCYYNPHFYRCYYNPYLVFN